MCHWRMEQKNGNKECSCCGDIFDDHRDHVTKCPTCRFLKETPESSGFNSFFEETDSLTEECLSHGISDLVLDPLFCTIKAEELLGIMDLCYHAARQSPRVYQTILLYLREETVEDIGNKIGVTRERVRQYASEGLKRLKHPHTLRQMSVILGCSFYEYFKINIHEKRWYECFDFEQRYIR